MPIQIADMQRLLVELTQDEEVDPDKWGKDEGIDDEVFTFLFEQFAAAITMAVTAGEVPIDNAVPSLIGTAFMLGWETHKQYGVR